MRFTLLKILYVASIIGAFILPWMAVELYKAFHNNESTKSYTLVMCICSGIIVFTILMMLNEGLHLI